MSVICIRAVRNVQSGGSGARSRSVAYIGDNINA